MEEDDTCKFNLPAGGMRALASDLGVAEDKKGGEYIGNKITNAVFHAVLVLSYTWLVRVSLVVQLKSGFLPLFAKEGGLGYPCST